MEIMTSTVCKRRYDSPPHIYSNKFRCRPSLEARVDPTYGQRSALPGLDDENNFFGDDDESKDHEGIKALEYLRSVRQEATEIPNILVAPQSADEQSYDDAPDGYLSRYEDGAFLSISDDQQEQDQSAEEGASVSQHELFGSILSRYNALRTFLRVKPPEDLVSKLNSNQPIYVGPLNKNLAKLWIGYIKNIDPVPVQVASMDKNTVLRLLGLLAQGTVLKSGLKVKTCVSRWAWSLLARLPERGSLTSEEISVIRDLGKKTVLLSASLRKHKEWEAGLLEVEVDFDNQLDEDQIRDPVNEDEVQLMPDDTDELEPIDIEMSNASDKASDDNVIEQSPNVKRSPNADEPPGRRLNENSIDLMQTSTQESRPDTASHNSVIILSDESTGPDHESKELLAAKARILQRLSDEKYEEPINLEPEITAKPTPSDLLSSPPFWNSHATVDMILTVVGEVYGQRDLLEYRGDWENYV